MKTKLTTEQSQHLFELGVPDEKASLCEQAFDDGYRKNPIFTLTDLLEILPKEIESKNGTLWLIMEMSDDNSAVYYKYIAHRGYKEYFEAEELIDALYELTVWCLKEKHLKFE